MATIGQALISPESGWKRYDNDTMGIIFTGTWLVNTLSTNYYMNGTSRYTRTVGDTVRFKFKGTKLRIISYSYSSYSNNVKISIDGLVESYSNKGVGHIGYALLYEKLGLEDKVHEVIITMQDTSYLDFDCIDIDATGTIVSPVLNYLTEKTELSELQIGDVISCDYVAYSNAVSTFSNLGNAQLSPLPKIPTEAPSGSFYFIMVGYDLQGRKKLIADRAIQKISWDNLNSLGYLSNVKIDKEYYLKYGSLSSLDTDKVKVTPSSEYDQDNYSAKSVFEYYENTQKCWTSATQTSASIIFDFKQQKEFKTFTIGQPVGYTNAERKHKTITLSAKKNLEDSWTVLRNVLESELNMSAGTFKEFATNSNETYRYYKLEITNGGDYVVLNHVNFSEEVKYPFSLSLLTGGTSAADKENEYDKILLEYNLNGKVLLSDLINIWSTGTNEWTSTTGSSGANYRVIRNEVNYSQSTPSSYTNGWRPVLYVDIPFLEKFMLFKNSTYYGLNSFTATTRPTKEIIEANGVEKSSIKELMTQNNLQLPLNIIELTSIKKNTLSAKLFKSYVKLKTKNPFKVLHLKELNNFNCIGTNSKFALSSDNTAWKKYNGSVWETVDLTSNNDSLFTSLNSLTELNSLTDVAFKQILNSESEFYLFVMLGNEGELDAIQMNIDLEGYFKLIASDIVVDEEKEEVKITFPQDGNYRVKYQKLR